MTRFFLLRVIYLAIVIIIPFCNAISDKEMHIKLIADVIQSDERPSFVSSDICWAKQDLRHLVKRLQQLERATTVRFLKFNMNPSAIYLADLSCDADILLKKAAERQMFSKPYRWMIFGNKKNDLVPLELNALNILTDSEVMMIQEIDQESFVLNLIYKKKTSSPWFVEYFGSWNFKGGLNKSLRMRASAPTRRKNFGLENLDVGVVVNDNNTKNNLWDIRSSTDSIGKSSFRMAMDLCAYLNATMNVVFTDSWGYQRNGTWDGMIGASLRGEIEIGGTMLFINQDRIPYYEFLLPCSSSMSVMFLFREPPLSYQHNIFTLPYKSNVWYCIIGFTGIVGAIVYVNALWEAEKYKTNYLDANDDSILRTNISDVAIFICSAVFQQGSSVEFKGSLGRVVMLLIFMIFLFLFTSYAASIVALLQSSSKEIKTLSDLLNSRLELGTHDTVYNRFYFSTATDPVKKAIYETKIARKGYKSNFMSLEEGIKKLQKEPFAFNMQVNTGYKLVEKFFLEHEKCGLQTIEYIDNVQVWVGGRKNSSYSEIFRVGLLNMDTINVLHPLYLKDVFENYKDKKIDFLRTKEHGLTDRVMGLMFSKKPVCSSRGGNFKSVRMIDFYPALLVLIYGAILSFALLGLEIFVHKRCCFSHKYLQS